MKRSFIAIILILLFLEVRLYPCLSFYTGRVQADNIANVEMPGDHSRIVTIGTLGMGEAIAGFTLAEVLITLTVIGVIAALTIPSLIANIQDAQLKTAWKKAYSDLNGVTIRLLSDNGGNLKNLCPVYGDNNCFRDKYLQYMSYVKACPNGQYRGNCWHENNSWSQLNGVPRDNGIGADSGAILNNGSLMYFEYYYPDCSDTTTPGTTLAVCGVVYTDVNGFKGPNVIGKDIYAVWLLENGIIPFGTKDSRVYTCRPTGSGQGCATVYLRDQTSY